MEKTKSKADIKNTEKIKTQIQILNGTECIRFKDVPAILLDMDPAEDYHQMCQDQNFAMWFKLEDAEYRKIEKQLNPNLKELTFWFNTPDEELLNYFLIKKNIKNNKGGVVGGIEAGIYTYGELREMEVAIIEAKKEYLKKRD